MDYPIKETIKRLRPQGRTTANQQYGTTMGTGSRSSQGWTRQYLHAGGLL